MAHFAKIDLNNNVIDVVVVNNEVLKGPNGNEIEKLGIDFLNNLYNYPNWVQTSFNKNFRKNYAGIGFTYDQQRDAFIPPKPFNSWILNEDTCLWNAPVVIPDDNNIYLWNETTQNWDLQQS